MQSWKTCCRYCALAIVTFFLGMTPSVSKDLKGLQSAYSSKGSKDPILVGAHDWKSQAKLGFNFIFSPGTAAKYDVFHIYKFRDVKDIIWNKSEKEVPALDIIVSKKKMHSGFIVKTQDVKNIFESSADFQSFEKSLEDQGFIARFASPIKLKSTKVEPSYMVIHRAGFTPDNIGVSQDTIEAAKALTKKISGKSTNQ